MSSYKQVTAVPSSFKDFMRKLYESARPRTVLLVDSVRSDGGGIALCGKKNYPKRLATSDQGFGSKTVAIVPTWAAQKNWPGRFVRLSDLHP